MRVLLVAEDCNPELDSVPGYGYKACSAISKHVDAVLATPIKNAPAISKVGCGSAQIVYIDNRYVWRPTYSLARWLRERAGWTSYVALAYFFNLAFEFGVWRRFAQELHNRRFDVVHRVTPMSPTLASPLAKRSPVPFVIGPLNGGLKWPSEFRKELNREREWLTFVRDASHFFPYYQSTYQHAAAVLAGFQHTIDDLPGHCHERVIDFAEVGIEPALFGKPTVRTDSGRLTFLFVGRFVPFKCPDVAIQAFAHSPILRQHRLIMVGDGQDREMLVGLVKAHKLESCVEFVGWRSHPEVAEIMRSADVFVYPSIRELGAGVVVEALATGLPCVAVDYGAPGTLVRDCGIVIPMGNKSHLVAAFRSALERLATDAPLRAEFSRKSHHKAVTHYSWDSKAVKTVEVYRWTLGLRLSKPTFFETPTGS